MGAATIALSDLPGASNPDVVVRPDGGLQLFFSAIRPGASGIQTSTAGAAGTGWSASAKVSFDSQGGEPGATLDRNGTPIFAWSAGTNTYFHVGTNPGDKDVFLGPGPQCCYYNPEVAVDEASQQAFVAFHSNVAKLPGIFVQRIVPTVGERQLAPKSLTGGSFLQPDHRTPLVARRGGGVYLAYCGGYPVCTQVLLWRVGGAVLLVAREGQDVEDVNLTRGPGGRLWVMWHDPRRGKVYAMRTNEAANRVGAVVAVSPPPGTSAVWGVFGEGSPGALDLLAHVSTPGSLATWHTQVLPGLSLSCRAGKRVTCAVRNAGDPVAGATVRVGGKTLKTSAAGVVSTKLRHGPYRATASKPGYTPASARVRA